MSARVSRALRIRETVAVYLLFAHARVVTGVANVLKMGWPLVVLTDPEPAHAEAVLTEHRPGVVETFPNTFILWEEMASSAARPFANVSWFLNTFDAMHPRARNALLESSSRRMPRYIQMYGQTETGPVTLRVYPRGAHRHAHPRCVGYPIPGFSRTTVLGDRSGGPILAKSKALILGYAGREAEYREKLDGGWWRMTDLGCKTRWGCLHLLDREVDESDAVASLLALEDMILERLPGLAEVALIPKADGPPVPLVCTRDNRPFDESAWGAATADLELLMPPVHCTWEEIPHTGTWKVRRAEARRRLDDGRLAGLRAAA
jgi:acyl-coenzyme A synthetase/AMP-(fatty) acid ligase